MAKQMELSKDDKDALLKLYEENGKLFFTFIEWRYKIMNRFFLALAALFFTVQWMYGKSNLIEFIFIPFLIGSVFSVFLALMDNVNQRVIVNCFRIGSDIEKKLISFDGIYKFFLKDFHIKESKKMLTYRLILQILYFGCAIILLIGAVYFYLKFKVVKL